MSNDLPVLGSSGPSPLVAVCGALSSFTTLIESPFFTDNFAGSYEGLPWVEAPEGIVNVTEGPPALVALDAPVALEEFVADDDEAFCVGEPGLTNVSYPVPFDASPPPLLAD